MGQVVISHLAPHDETEVVFLTDLALALEARGLRPVIWSAIYDRRFAPWYWPHNWRLKRLPEFFCDLPESGGLPEAVDAGKWMPRIEILAKQDWPDASARETSFRHLAAVCARTVDALDPALLLSWNTLCPHTGIAADLCRARGGQAWLLERAVFPQTWFVEPGGLVGLSELVRPSLEELVPPARAADYEARGAAYLRDTDFASYNRYAQVPHSPEMERLMAEPFAGQRPRVAFFPPDDGTLGFIPADTPDRRATVPHYETSFEAAKALSAAHDGLTIFKPHPSFLERRFDTAGCPNLHVVDYDFRKVMDWADVVATTGSGLEFVALAKDKPVLLLGNDLLAGKGIAYEAQDPARLGEAVAAAYAREGWEDRRTRFHRYCGYLLSEKLGRPGDTPAPARRPEEIAEQLAEAAGDAGKPMSDEAFAARRREVLTEKWAKKLEKDGAQTVSIRSSAEVSVETDPDALLDLLASAPPEHLVLDFDHTLILENSTERFLKSTRPQTLVFFVAMASDLFVRAVGAFGLCRPDRWRDFMRVLAVTVVLPWSWPWWRIRAGRRMAGMVNARLAEAVARSGAREITIISFGMAHLIAPLAAHLPFRARLLACRAFPRPENLRKKGKAAALTDATDGAALHQAVFVTDSREDAELFPLMGRNFLIEWAPYTAKAFDRLYVPLRYAVQGKYSRRRYFLNQIVKEDLLILYLAYAFTPLNALALTFLFFSLYCIYELGYYANDHRAASNEVKPTLSKDAARFQQVRLGFRPWLWAAVLGVCGIALAYWPETRAALAGTPGALGFLLGLCAVWAGVLVLLDGVFTLFNALRTANRIYVFPFLHLFKNFGFAAILPLTPLGVLLLTAQIITQTTNYLIYRFGGDTARFNRQGWRFAVFGMLAGVLIPATQAVSFAAAPVQTGLIILWSGVRTLERTLRKSIERMAVGAAVRWVRRVIGT